MWQHVSSCLNKPTIFIYSLNCHFMTADVSNSTCSFMGEIKWFYLKPLKYTSCFDRREKILEVNVKDKILTDVLAGIVNYRSALNKTIC